MTKNPLPSRTRASRAFAWSICVYGLVGAADASYAQERRSQSAYATAFTEYTDNVARSPVSEKSAYVYGVSGGVSVATKRRWFDADLEADLSYLDSDSGLYDSGVLGNALGHLTFTPIPERFNWFVEGVYGQIPVEGRLADTPANRQDFTSLTTGPQILVPLGARDLVELRGSYATINYEVTLDDSEQTEGSLSILHRLSPHQTFRLLASTADTTYDREELFRDYKQNRAFLEWEAIGARTNLLVQAGYEVLDQEGEAKSGSTLYNVRMRRKLGQRSSLILQVDQSLSDTSSAFSQRLEFTGVGGGAVDVSANPGVFRARSGKVHYQTQAKELEIDVSGTYEQDRYLKDQSLVSDNRNAIFSGVSIFKRLTPVIAVGVFGDLTDADYIEQDFKYTEWDLGVMGSWRIARSVGLQLSAARTDRSGGFDEGGFKENVMRLSVFYATDGVPLDIRERPGHR